MATMIVLVSLLSMLGGLGLGAPAQEPRVGWEVGDRFPDLELPALADGSPLSIRDFRGRKVVLHVFASW